MNTHEKVVAILYLISGFLTLLASVIIFMALGAAGGIAVLQGEAEAAGILGIVMLGICGFLSILALPEIIGGWALLAGKSWGRVLVLVLGFINLLNLPFGTLLGIYTLWALLRDEEAVTPQPMAA